jgi:hypothetical protein
LAAILAAAFLAIFTRCHCRCSVHRLLLLPSVSTAAASNIFIQFKRYPCFEADVALPLLLHVLQGRCPAWESLQHTGLHSSLHIELIKGQKVVIAVGSININQHCRAARPRAAADGCTAQKQPLGEARGLRIDTGRQAGKGVAGQKEDDAQCAVNLAACRMHNSTDSPSSC